MSLEARILALAQSIGADIKTLITGKVEKVAGKSLSTEDYTTTEKTKLAGIGAGANVTSVAGKTGVVTLVKADVGLGSADNTADSAKPVSGPQQTALDAKVSKTGNESINGIKAFSSAPTFPLLGGTDNSSSAASTATVRALMAQFGLGASELVQLANADDMTLKPGWYITTAATTGTIPTTYGIIRSDSLAGGGSTNTWALYTFYATNGKIYTRFSINLAAWSPWREQVFATGADFTGPVSVASPLKIGQYTLTTLPSAAAYNGYEIDVTNATGGSKRCRSNGTVWQILNTTTTVS